MADLFSDSDILIGILAIQQPSLAPWAREILNRRENDLGFGAELARSLKELALAAPAPLAERLLASVPKDGAAEHFFARSMERGIEQARVVMACNMHIARASVAKLAIAAPQLAPIGSLDSPCAKLASCGVAFDSAHLHELAQTARKNDFGDGCWSLLRLARGEHDGPRLAPEDIRREAGNFIKLSLCQSFDPQRADTAVAAAARLRDAGLASKDDLDWMLIFACHAGAASACDGLGKHGATWNHAHPTARVALRAGLASIFKRLGQAPEATAEAIALIQAAAKLGAAATDGHCPALSPLWALYQEPSRQPISAASRERAIVISKELKKAGFGLDAGNGAGLQEAACQAAGTRSGYQAFELLLDLGADPKACGTNLLLAPLTGMDGSDPIQEPTRKWLSRLSQLGIEPQQIPADSPLKDNAAAAAIADAKSLPYASLLLSMGSPAHWSDPATGETLPTLLARSSTRAAHALMAEILAHPQARELVDQTPSIKAGVNALGRACLNLDLPMAKLLLDAGADPNARDASGRTSLHHVAKKFGTQAEAKAAPLVEALIAAGADPGALEKKGRTPAQAMAARAPLGALAALLERRPQDLLGDGLAARAAQAKVVRRGGAALAIVEQAVLKTDPGASAARPAKPRRI